jgi:hypothetical protein
VVSGATTPVAGIIGGGVNFSSSNTGVIALPGFGIFSGAPYTVSGWMNPMVLQMDNVLFASCPALSADQCLFLVLRNGLAYMGFYGDDLSAGSVTAGTWAYLTFTYDGSHFREIYLNGILLTSGTSSGVLSATNTFTTTGGPSLGTATNASADELEISNVVRSPNWIATQFNNQSSPSTFYSLTVPSGPTGLTAEAATSQVSLNWNASTGATGYNVKLAYTSGGPYFTIATVTTTTYVATGLINGVTSYFVVSAIDGTGEGPNSSEVNAIPLAIPQGVTATGGGGQVVVDWQPSSGAVTYNVQRFVYLGPLTTIATGVTGTHYTDTTGTPGTTYYYLVNGVNSNGVSANSAFAGATP